MAIRDAKGNLHSEINGRFIEKQEEARLIYDSDAYFYARCIGAYEFNRIDTAHHLRHMIELGFSSAKDYEKAAVVFFNSDRGKLYFSHARKRYYRYDDKTGEMAVSSDGVIHTYMSVRKQKFEKTRKQDKLEEVRYERIGGMPHLRYKV